MLGTSTSLSELPGVPPCFHHLSTVLTGIKDTVFPAKRSSNHRLEQYPIYRGILQRCSVLYASQYGAMILKPQHHSTHLKVPCETVYLYHE